MGGSDVPSAADGRGRRRAASSRDVARGRARDRRGEDARHRGKRGGRRAEEECASAREATRGGRTAQRNRDETLSSSL